MRALFDTNVLLDVFLRRVGGDVGVQLFDWFKPLGRQACVTLPSLATIAYYLDKAGDSPVAIRARMRTVNRWAEVATGGAQILRRALELPMDDFEDAMQAALAESCAAEVIVTRNVSDFATSPVPAMTPEDFLARFAQRE